MELMPFALSSALAAFREELRALQAEWTPQREGFRAFARLDLQPDTVAVVQAMIAVYERRLGLVTAELLDLEALLDDGYPALPSRPVPKAVYEDLTTQLLEQEAAMEKVTLAQEAVAGHITAEAVEDSGEQA